jgi:hypothetical protein
VADEILADEVPEVHHRQVMRESRGKADPQQVNALLPERLGS